MGSVLYFLYTLLGVEVKFKHLSYPVLIQPTLIKEMRNIEEYPEVLNVGGSVTLMELEKSLKNQIDEKPGEIFIIFQTWNFAKYFICIAY